MTTLSRGGVKALVVRPLKKHFFYGFSKVCMKTIAIMFVYEEGKGKKMLVKKIHSALVVLFFGYEIMIQKFFSFWHSTFVFLRLLKKGLMYSRFH